MDKALDKAKSVAGGTSGLAAQLTEHNPARPITSQAVSQWKRVPVERVLDVETITGISRYQLRPDIFGAAEPKQQRVGA